MRRPGLVVSLLIAALVLGVAGGYGVVHVTRLALARTHDSRPAPTPSSVSQPESATPTPTSTPTPSSTDEPGWAGVVAKLRDGVVRLQVAGCAPGQNWMGSGFVVGPHLIMTAGHMVRQGRTVSVKADGVITTAQVIAFDMDTDSALLSTPTAFTGHSLQLSTTPLQLGSDLAILGYPLGVNDLRVSTGVVSGLDEQVTYSDFTVQHAFVTDAATNGGNSGGPVIDRTGTVIGLVSGSREWSQQGDDRVPVQGTNYIIPSSSLAKSLSAWETKAPQRDGTCQGEQPPQQTALSVAVTVQSTHPHARDAALTLALEGESINTGNYEAAWNLFTPKMQHDMASLSAWKKGLSTSFWVSLDVRTVTGTGNSLAATTTLRTQQDAKDGYHGQTCSVFTIVYTMKRVDGVWLIDHAKGGTPSAC